MISVAFSQSNGELQKKRRQRQCQSSGVTSPGFHQQERGARADGLLFRGGKGLPLGKTEQGLDKPPTTPASILPPLFTLRSKN